MSVESKPKSTRPVVILLGSNFLAALVGGAFFLAASLRFDVTEVGIYGVLISIQWIIAGLVGTGLGVASMRLSTDYLVAGERTAAAGVTALAIIFAASIGPVGAGLCLALMGFISEQSFLSGALPMLVILWAGARSVLDCLRFALLAQQLYTRAGLLMMLSAVTGLIALIVVMLGDTLTLERLLVAHVFGLGTSAVMGLAFMLPLWRGGVDMSKRRLWKLLTYARWPALSEGSRLLQAHLGPFILVAAAGSAQAGLFSLGRYPAYVFGVVVASLYQYWLPEAARERHDQFTRFLGRHMGLAGLMGLGMVVGALLISPLLPRLGANFNTVGPLFLLNALSFALVLLVGPIIAVYHAMHKPQLELGLGLGCLPALVGIAVVLSVPYGALGMVWAQVITGLVALGLGAWLLWQQLKRSEREMETYRLRTM